MLATRAKFADELSRLAKAQQDDMPVVARKLIGGKEAALKSTVLDPDIEGLKIAPIAKQRMQKARNAKQVQQQGLGGITSAFELHGLRSELLQIARETTKPNQARISQELAEAILQDLGAQRGKVVGELGAAYRTALDFTIDVQNTFRRGPIARLLDRRSSPDLTLERSILKSGPTGGVEMRALNEAMERNGHLPEMHSAIEDFLKDEFKRRVLKAGAVDKKAAALFMEQHGDMFTELPGLREPFDEVIKSGNIAALRQKRFEGISTGVIDTRISRSEIFIGAPADKAFGKVFSSARPAKIMRALVRLARKDSTGKALQGLKGGFVQYLLRQAEVGTALGATGEKLLSGVKFNELLKSRDIKFAVQQLFTSTEQRRLRIIGNTAFKLEKAVQAKPLKGEAIGGEANVITRVLRQIGAARAGSAVARTVGGGGIQIPAIFSGLSRQMTERGFQMSATRLLYDSINNEKLFAAMLARGGTPARDRFIRRQINTWILGVVNEQTRGEDEPAPR